MSLPDTAFIFVLALIIFGPKKLPEIGRQLGRLVGEFRRASNEFKFQIEEELRLADVSDSPKHSAPNSTAESSISESDSTPSSIDSEAVSDDSTTSDLTYPEETLPVGQHPNMEYQDSYELNDHNEKLAESESAGDIQEGDVSADTIPTIRAAEGSQPRTSLPHSGTDSAVSTAAEATTPVIGGETEPSAQVADISSAEASISEPEDEPAVPTTASTIADVTHG